MDIKIKQSDTDYFVYLDNNSDYTLSGGWEQKWFKRKAVLFDQNDKLKLEVSNSFRLDFWNISYNIQIPDSNISAKLNPIKIWKGHWQLIVANDTYDFYLHKGHRKALFKNGNQIASYDKKYVQLFESDTFIIKANKEELIELLIAFELCFDLGSHNDGATMTADAGNISKGLKSYNPNWKPDDEK